ncbi:MAG: alpha-glucan phosphorylase [Verrucomicrobia bacterium]|nr:MAG: alpha-glucan phosphorylase [Verrucomicrobiota bacterium]PYK76003.1 MAG: alpha-glucan phosphorylase [Verrucomicrobiota bacterium]
MTRTRMPTFQTYNVTPILPATLEPLREMSFNLWWTWEPSARRLFRHLDPELWDRTNHNPIRMLQLSRQSRLEELSQDKNFLRELKQVFEEFEKYLGRHDTYGKTGAGSGIKNPIAYFSAEFGFHESIPNYSGGLGILASDHCKSASDLDLNFVAIGLLYRHGYFRQQIDKEGIQGAINLNQNFYHLPIREVRRGDTKLLISVPILDREVFARLWELRVGRVNVYLLDTDIPENTAEDRLITAELYGGDLEMRMRQEVMLGIGGVKALTALGIQPDVFHMNEGHSAFLALERIRLNVVEKKLDFYSALQVVAAANVFTTHTPVPAGQDSFSREMMQKYFGKFAKELNIPFDELFSFGQTRLNPNDPLSMTILALRLSRHANGVSKLHGEVTRSLWKDVWSGVPVHEVPITSITNGVHTKTWMAPEFAALYRKHLGAWEEHLTEPEFWRGVIDIPDAQLWETHQKLKRRLIDFVRDRERQRRERMGESPEFIRKVNRILDPETLTIGFARRFATYKRGTLLFSDKERLKRLVNDTTRPVQFIFAGKAHPRDEAGKALIQEVYKFSREPGLENRVVFLEDYDSYIARRLVQGVDLWLNHPLRPLEASGTSGMKSAPNGGINLSVLDGWWREGYNCSNGWAIGAEIDNGTTEFQNEVDASSLYQLLENQIVPLYYAKPDGKLPLAWLQLMRESIRSVTPVFNTQRMVKEYTEQLYIPAAQAHENFSRDACGAATQLSQWKTQIRKDWSEVKISDVQAGNKDRQNILVGESLQISARVRLGAVDPRHVRVEAYHGEIDDGDIRNPTATVLNQSSKADGDGNYIYQGSVPATESGTYGFSVRVVPTHPCLMQAHELRLITWS